MARHVSVGKPANEAEKWAFNFLKENLPDHYILITNVDVYSDTNQPFEVDAIVIADWGVYLVDVKGYKGDMVNRHCKYFCVTAKFKCNPSVGLRTQ